MGAPSSRVLALYWHMGPDEIRAAIQHHLRALDYAARRPEVLYYNAVNGAPSWLRALEFDAVILHTTFLCMRWTPWFHVWKWKTRWLRDLHSIKIALPQDEYDHSEILDEWLAELGVSVIFTNFDEARRKTLYPIMSERAEFRRAFTGYIDEQAASALEGRLRPTHARPWDIVYRATHLPYWFGSHGQLKHRIAGIVAARASEHGLACDISTRWEDTIVGKRWLDFLASGRVVIGCESGSSVLDRRGEIQARIRRLLRDEPNATFDAVSRQLPSGWDDYRFFAISPRHFEAVITRTCQVLVEGEYDSILEPDRHYIPLRRDFSNLDEVLEKIRDRRLVEEVAARAYREIYREGRYTYRTLAAEIEGVLGEPPRWPGLASRARRSVLWWLAQIVGRVHAVVGVRITRLLRWTRGVWRVLGGSRSSLARGLAAVRLVVGSEPLRRLMRAYLANPDVRAAVRLDELMFDLLRVGFVLKMQARELATWPTFRVDVTLDESGGRVILRSRRLGSESPETAPWPTLEPASTADALDGGRIREIVWDHSAVGSAVSYPVMRGHWVAVSVGERGVYRFRALPALATRLPAETAGVLVAVSTTRPRPLSLLRRIRADVRTYAALGLVIGREVVRTPALRSLVLAWLGDRKLRRAAGGAARLLPDLLRLTMVRRGLACDPASRARFRIEPSYDAAEAMLLFRSVAVAEGAGSGPRPGVSATTSSAVPGPERPLRQIVWDHSAFGVSAPSPVLSSTPLPIAIGPLGRYSFLALEMLARRHPRKVWAALGLRGLPTVDSPPATVSTR